MRIGFFGGSFNPIHNGHIALAREIMVEAGLQEVWFVVSPHNPLKESVTLMPDSDRLAMVEQALLGEPGMRASDCEFRMPRPSYTQHTLEMLRRDCPHDEFVLLVGADNWACFNKWRNHAEILRHHAVAVYPRRGYTVDAGSMPQGVTLLHTSLFDVSSTQVRQLFMAGQSVAHLVPACVEEYLKAHPQLLPRKSGDVCPVQ